MTRPSLCPGLLPALIAGLLLGCEPRAPAPTARAAPAETRVAVEARLARPGRLTRELSLSGDLLPLERTLVMSEIDGVIAEIAASPQIIKAEVDGREVQFRMRLSLGDRVKKGDVILRFKPEDFRLALESAKARLARARAELASLQAWKRPEDVRALEAGLREQAARHEEARRELARVKQLQASRAISERLADQAQMGYEAAAAARERAQASLDIARAGPTEAELAVARSAVAIAEAAVAEKDAALEKTVIRAPYDAAITEVYVGVGERVTAQPRVELVELLDLSAILAEVGVPEQYGGALAVNDAVEVFVPGVAEPAPGIIVRINDKVEPASRTFRVRCAIDNRDGRYKAGQSGRVRLRIASVQGKIVIPVAAVVYRDGEPGVFVVEDERARLKPVRLGLSNGRELEVVEGLGEGERLIIRDPAILADGMSVRVVEAGEDQR